MWEGNGALTRRRDSLQHTSTANKSSSTAAGITAISDISSSSNGPQIGGTGSNVLESKA